jgi:hypothetical protein
VDAARRRSIQEKIGPVAPLPFGPEVLVRVCVIALFLLAACAPTETSVDGGCTNGLDDDNDGRQDCEDPECADRAECAGDDDDSAG